MSVETTPAVRDWTEMRIRSEYLEMPGLKLTAAQASRFWNLGVEDGRRALDRLVEAQILRRTADGHYLLIAGSPAR